MKCLHLYNKYITLCVILGKGRVKRIVVGKNDFAFFFKRLHLDSVIFNMNLKLKNTLPALLKSKHMTLKELSVATSISPSTLSGWKNGASPRDLGELRTCAQYFGVSIDYLLFGEDSTQANLESLLTENVFDGFLKVKIERVIQKK